MSNQACVISRNQGRVHVKAFLWGLTKVMKHGLNLVKKCAAVSTIGLANRPVYMRKWDIKCFETCCNKAPATADRQEEYWLAASQEIRKLSPQPWSSRTYDEQQPNFGRVFIGSCANQIAFTEWRPHGPHRPRQHCCSASTEVTWPKGHSLKYIESPS